MSTSVKIGIIGGSGLDNPDILKNRSEKKVNTIFGEPSDVLVLGEIEDVPCVVLARHGRQHSITPGQVNYRANIWALKEEGCTHVLASTACGSLQEEIKPGDVVILDNFIDRTQGRAQTFHDGKTGHPKGIVHLPMEPAFCQRTRQILLSTAASLNIPCHKSGTVIAIEGPRYSSKAESMMFKQWGGHLINMTSVPEIVLAKEAGLCYAAIALATDYDCWRTSTVTHGDVVATFEKNILKVTNIITNAVPAIANEEWECTLQQLEELTKPL